MKASFALMMVPLLVICTAGAGYAVESGTCRCRDGIVSIGDAMVEVIAKCGEPTMKSQREEKRPGREKKSSSIVTVDEWNYNFGPEAFMYAIIFANGRVEKIDSLDSGY